MSRGSCGIFLQVTLIGHTHWSSPSKARTFRYFIGNTSMSQKLHVLQNAWGDKKL